LAARQSRNRITDILHNLKNEISIRGEFEEYEDDLGTLGDQRDGLDDSISPRIDVNRPKDGMRLLQNYFSGPQANRRVLLFENFVSLLEGQQNDGGYGDTYRNKMDRDYLGNGVYRGINDLGINDLGLNDRASTLDTLGALGGIGGLGGGIGGITSILGGVDPLMRQPLDRRTIG
jgi:hypothetical protein